MRELEYGVFFNTQENNKELRLVGIKRKDQKIYSANTRNEYCVERLPEEFLVCVPAIDLERFLRKVMFSTMPNPSGAPSLT